MTVLQILGRRLGEAILLEAPRPVGEQTAKIAAGLGSDGRWPDVDYASDQVANDWGPTVHLARMRELAVAYARGERSLAVPLGRAIDGWLKANPVSRNWWHNQIGTPMSLGDTLVLAEPMLTDDQRALGTERLGGQLWEDKTAQNLIWVAEVALRSAVMSGDEEIAADAFRRIRDEIKIVTGEGVQLDSSFHQHDAQLYFGGYGHEFALSTTRLAYLGDGTAFGFTPEQVTIIRNYLLDGLRYAVHRGRYDFTAMGRCLTRPDAQDDAAELSTSLTYLDRLGPGRSAEIAEFRGALAGSPKLAGSRYFWRSDYFAHHRPGWSASVKMASVNTVPTEAGNGEGLRSWYLGEGVGPLWTTGTEYLDIFPVWDWRRLPGSTIEQQTGELPIPRWHLTPDGKPFRGRHDHVGGLSDETYGCCVMRVGKDHLEDGFSSWFFGDQHVVALGAGLAAPAADSAVVTTLTQVLQSGPVSYQDASGVQTLDQPASLRRRGVRWVQHAGVRYTFSSPADEVIIELAARTGSWHDIGSGQSDEPLTKNLVTIGIDHGPHPQAAAYGYLVTPVADEARDHELPVVIANRPELQAVWHPTEGLAQLAFHAPGRCAVLDGPTVEVDRPLLVQLSRERPGRIAIADPRRRGGDARISIGEERPRTITLPDGQEAGRTVIIGP